MTKMVKTVEGEWYHQRVILVELSPRLVNPASFIGKSHALKACFYLNDLTIVS